MSLLQILLSTNSKLMRLMMRLSWRSKFPKNT